MLISFFVLLASARKENSDEGISFNFTNFTRGDQGVTLLGQANIMANGILALTNHTNPTWNTGRALYSKPVPIWDSATGNVASFVTSFSFVVQEIKGAIPADGIVFFLAPEARIPDNSAGGQLGIVNANKAYNPFVGVEFDTYSNNWDPKSAHIGIDASSLISLRTVKWNKVSGSLVKVSIIYDSLSKTLSVVVTHENGQISTIAQVVDLKAVLGEKVRVGFTAATTTGRELYDIHAWSFTSTLVTATSSTSKNMNIASYA
nr:lectin [Robinia pseudoacacia]